jgi:hypothetical protein
MKIPTKVPEKGFYYHYKHDLQKGWNDHTYEVLGIGRNTEEENSYTVIYRPLYKNDWMQPADYQSRPFEMFVENVTKDGKTFPRFTKITDPEVIAKLEAIKQKMYPS